MKGVIKYTLFYKSVMSEIKTNKKKFWGILLQLPKKKKKCSAIINAAVNNMSCTAFTGDQRGNDEATVSTDQNKKKKKNNKKTHTHTIQSFHIH